MKYANTIKEFTAVSETVEAGGVGPAGPQGPAGADGAAGAAGAQGPQGDAGPGVAIGGNTGQVLAKSSDANYATEWVTPSSGLTQAQILARGLGA